MNKRILILLLFLIIFSIILNHNHNNKFEVNRIIYLEPNNYTLTEYLRNRANNKNVNEYENGNKQEMYVFEHESTDQVDANIDYRYIGPNPNNYIYFNCTDDNDTNTCEIWRILGVFEVENENEEKEERVKIVHDTTIGKIIFDENGSNNYSESTLKEYLNSGDYYNSIGVKYRNMIAPTKYYLGGTEQFSLNADDYYAIERNSTNGYGSWIGNIGLLYPSDFAYIYGHGVENCDDLYGCNGAKSNWMIKNNTYFYDNDYSSGSTFILASRLITPLSNYSIYYIRNGGGISAGYNGPGQYGILSFASFIKPTLYLKNNLQVNSGDGSLNNPYTIKEISIENDSNENESTELNNDNYNIVEYNNIENNSNDNKDELINKNDTNNQVISNPQTSDRINGYILTMMISILLMIIIIKMGKSFN